MDIRFVPLWRKRQISADVVHTHRGQIWPLNWLTDCIFEQSHGYRKWAHSHIYVSSGLSLWGPPFRIGTHSDMAVIEVL
jgi:predicted MPP superfamily phosphohydrolase